MKEPLEPIAVAFVDDTIKAVDDMAVDEIERAVKQCASMAHKFAKHVLWLNDVSRALREHGSANIRELPISVVLDLEIRRPFFPEEEEQR